jgi:hypothetical protein
VDAASWDLTLQADRDQVVTLHLLYYPRWKAYVDGQPVGLHMQSETGYAQLDVPAGVHQIALRYGPTAAQSIGLALSLLTLLGLLAIAICSRAIKRRPAPTGADVTLTSPIPHLPQSGQDSEESFDALRTGSREAKHGDSSLAPPWWLLVGLTAVLGFKVFYIDGHTTWLRCVSTPTRVCDAQVRVEIPFAGGPSLRGYSVSQTRLTPGQTVRVNLVWKGEPDPARRLTSFVHIRNSQQNGPTNPRTGNEIWAQDEHETPAGLLTTEYLPGRLYLDEFRVRLPEDMPPGEYFLEIGWADLAASEQLEPQADAVKPPLGILWRSILLPSLTVTGGAT